MPFKVTGSGVAAPELLISMPSPVFPFAVMLEVVIAPWEKIIRPLLLLLENTLFPVKVTDLAAVPEATLVMLAPRPRVELIEVMLLKVIIPTVEIYKLSPTLPSRELTPVMLTFPAAPAPSEIIDTPYPARFEFTVSEEVVTAPLE